MQPTTPISQIKRFYSESGARQKVAAGYAITVLLILLFPPFALHYPNGRIDNAGYHFILFGSEDHARATIHLSALVIQLIAISLIAVALWFAVREPSKPKNSLHADPVPDYKNRMNAIDDAFENGDIDIREWSGQRDALLSQQIKAEIVSVMR